jgi:N-dimethylarginine dimethylaminohydrolase
LPEQFKDWDIIKVNEETDKSMRSKQKLIDLKVQDDDFHDTVLAVNTLSIDENTICLYDHYKHDTKLINALNKHKVEIVWVPFTYSHFFNQGLTCITLDLHRL